MNMPNIWERIVPFEWCLGYNEMYSRKYATVGNMPTMLHRRTIGNFFLSFLKVISLYGTSIAFIEHFTVHARSVLHLLCKRVTSWSHCLFGIETTDLLILNPFSSGVAKEINFKTLMITIFLWGRTCAEFQHSVITSCRRHIHLFK